MMNNIEYLKKILDLMKTPDQESLKLSKADTHHPGVFSLVIGGTEFGKLTRVFISDVKLKPFEVQLHTHRYPIKLTTIKGNIKHFRAFRSTTSNTVRMCEFEYRSPLNGGNGLKYLWDVNVKLEDQTLPLGSILELDENDFHTMSCSKGSIWIVEEQGFVRDSSRVLGVPFIVDGLYNEPKSFEINDKFQIVQKEIKNIINHFNLI